MSVKQKPYQVDEMWMRWIDPFREVIMRAGQVGLQASPMSTELNWAESSTRAR